MIICWRRINLDSKQNEILNKSKKLNNESLIIIGEIQNIFDDIMEHRLNNSIIGTLQCLSLDVIKKNNIQPTNEIEDVVITTI